MAYHVPNNLPQPRGRVAAIITELLKRQDDLNQRDVLKMEIHSKGSAIKIILPEFIDIHID